MTGTRCPAAHRDDPTPCDGPVVVKVVDRDGAHTEACVHHGARLLACLDDARVYPMPGQDDGPAMDVYLRAQAIPQAIRPFTWTTEPPPAP